MYRKQLTNVVQESVLEGRIPAKVIAKQIGKPYSTLLREMNPYDEKAKLGIETLMEIIRTTGDIAPLRFMAAEFGYGITTEDQGLEELAQA